MTASASARQIACRSVKTFPPRTHITPDSGKVAPKLLAMAGEVAQVDLVGDEAQSAECR